MNRRTWKEFITKRSTIWTLSLCLVGAIVLGGMAAVNKSRNNDDTSGETELGQIAYLEEDLGEEDADGSSIWAEGEDVLPDEGSLSDAASPSEEVSGSVLSENTSGSAAEDSTNGSTDGASDSDESTQIEANTEDGSVTADDISTASGSAAAGNTGTDNDALTADGTDAASNSEAADSSNVVSGSETADSSGAVSGSEAAGSSGAVSDSEAADSSGAASASVYENTDTDSNSDNGVSGDSEEASSASIVSEQALIEADVSFTAEDALLWPSAGTVILDYSMDQSVYFATLNQYKYNPALIISSETGNQVLASAKGIVESISIDEETGTTLVLNIGNGYKLTYGQLMEPAVSEGDVVEAGGLLAYVSDPTKYYSTEGSNLYFAMTKDGEPVDPVLYLE
ncbi:MAG: peptidoglycan DD-metalloendopeptidase family protein [Lachnospiraceae bacterium]|nr:peptidoglycan DD-metalloendopeptidase family protein [Lachnospiraceae bacterium]